MRYRYPNIEVVLFEGTFQEVQEWISTRVIDVGFLLHRTRGMESTFLATDEMQVFVAQGNTILPMAREGLGITILPRMMLHDLFL